MTTSSRFVRAVLRSPLRGMLSRSLVMLRLHGRHTDGLFELPVHYAPTPGGIVVVPGPDESRLWWHNLREPQAIHVLSRGRWRAATGLVLHPDDDRYPPALDDFAERWPDEYLAPDSPVVLVTWTDTSTQSTPVRSPHDRHD